MKYMLLIYSTENAITDEERQYCYEESTALTHELNSRGQFISASPLQPVATATTVRVREGKRLVTDGPFAETREHLGGYFMVDAKDLNEAISIASLRIGDANIMLSDGYCKGSANFSGITLSLSVPNEAAADRAFNALSDGGKIHMPLTQTFFSPRFGMVADRFGVPWMVIVPRN